MENAGKEDIPEDAERRGLGTPATRAAIIEKLVSGGFVERKGKNLIPTKAGVNLVTVLPELLTSPKLTADWEQRLNEVAKGQVSPEDFMDGIKAMAAELVQKYSHISEDGQKLFQPEKETVGLCPRCGKPVYEGKKNFACSDRLSQAHGRLGAAVERGGKGPGVAGGLHGRDRGDGGGAGAEILPH